MFCLLPGVAIGLLTGAATAANPKDQNNRESIISEFKIPRDGDAVLIPVQLKGKKYLFLLDTGTTSTIGDKSLLPLLGEPTGRLIEYQTSTGSGFARKYETPDLHIGKMVFTPEDGLIVLDLTVCRRAYGLPIYGLLGMDILIEHIVRLDFDAGKAFLQSAGLHAGHPVRLTFKAGCPYVHGVISKYDQPEAFLIDTGCGGHSTGGLREKRFQQLSERKRIQPTGKKLVADARRKTWRDGGQLELFSLGPFHHRNLHFLSHPSRSLIGLAYLSRFTVTFDFPRDTVYFKENSRFDKLEDLDRSGLVIVSRKGKAIVAFVHKGSPAERSGLKGGDEIMQIDGLKANNASLFVLEKRLCANGKMVRIRVKRANEEWEATIRLCSWWKDGGSK
jgi:hypothetical protein